MTTGTAVVAIGLVVLGGIIILAVEAGADRRGASDRGGRMTRVLILLFALGSLYFLLVRR